MGFRVTGVSDLIAGKRLLEDLLALRVDGTHALDVVLWHYLILCIKI